MGKAAKQISAEKLQVLKDVEMLKLLKCKLWTVKSGFCMTLHDSNHLGYWIGEVTIEILDLRATLDK